MIEWPAGRLPPSAPSINYNIDCRYGCRPFLVYPAPLADVASLAIDCENGPWDGDALTWQSDRDGYFGAGTDVDLPDPSPGIHEITLVATDSDDMVGESSVRVIIGSRVYLPVTLRP